MKRTYNIWAKADTDEVKTEFFVTDITDEENQLNNKNLRRMSDRERLRYLNQETVRPRVASFPISELYPEDEQRTRARMLCDYLNKIQEARERAERDTAFIDALTAGATVSTPVDQK